MTAPERPAAAPWRPDELDRTILRLLADGLGTDQVARHAGVSTRTVRRRVRALADELGVRSTVEVVVRAVRAGHI